MPIGQMVLCKFCYVNLNSPTNAAILRAQGSCLIRDDDPNGPLPPDNEGSYTRLSLTNAFAPGTILTVR